MTRKASVSISDDAAKADSGRTIAAANSGSKISPKDAQAQLLKSIPEKEMAIVKGWKVKQGQTHTTSEEQQRNLSASTGEIALPHSSPLCVLSLFCAESCTCRAAVVITKLDSGNSGASGVTGVNLAPGAGGPPMLSKLKKMGTSKMHKFTPMVTLEQSIAWLSEYGNADSSVLFENNCCFMFERGQFLEFEDIRDDDED